LHGLFQFLEHHIDLVLGDEAVIIQDRPEKAVLASVDVIIDLLTYGGFYLFKGHEPLRTAIAPNR